MANDGNLVNYGIFGAIILGILWLVSTVAGGNPAVPGPPAADANVGCGCGG